MKRLVDKHRQALALRKEGKSYSQIKKELGVSKGTLSRWLHKYPLSKSQLDKLLFKNERRIERFRETMRLKRRRRLKKIYKREARKWLPLSKRELFLAGLFLYWGEGGKTLPTTTILSNTNTQVIKLYLYWLIKCLKVDKKKIRVKLHLYKDMNEEKATSYWAKELGLQLKQFRKSYIKQTKLSGLTYKGFGHGTCNVIVEGVALKETIMMGIKAIADHYTREYKV